MDIKKTMSELEFRLQSYLSEIRYSCIENTPYIIEVGALTVGTDEKGKIITQNKLFPTQFSEKGVKTISSMTFKNCNNEIVIPKIYNKQEWYCEKIEYIEMTLNELKNLI
jgi:hypothetical protein